MSQPPRGLQLAQGWRSLSALDRSRLAPPMIAGATILALAAAVIALATQPLPLALLGAAAIVGLLLTMASGRLVRALLLVVLLDITFPIDVYLNYREPLAVAGAIGGWSISITTIALSVIYLIWAGRLLARVGSPLRFISGSSIYLLLYLATVVLSLLSARDLELALYEVFMLTQILLVYGYVMNIARSEQDIRWIVMVLVASLAVEGLIMIGLRALGSSVTFVGFEARIDPDGRVGGTIGSPNGAASYLTLAIAMGFSVLITSWPRRDRLLAAAACALGLIGLLLTQSRGGLIACGLALAVICAAATWRGWLSPVVPLLGASAVALLIVLLSGTLLARLLAYDGGSAYSRIPMMRLALKMIGDSPILGVGANHYALLIRDYLTPEFDQGWIYIVHNNYLLIWAEKGIVGLIAFVLFLGALAREAWRGWMRRDRALSPIALGFCAAIIGQMFHMGLDVFNGRTYLQLFWLLAALLAAMSQINRATDRKGRWHSTGSADSLGISPRS